MPDALQRAFREQARIKREARAATEFRVLELGREGLAAPAIAERMGLKRDYVSTVLRRARR